MYRGPSSKLGTIILKTKSGMKGTCGPRVGLCRSTIILKTKSGMKGQIANLLRLPVWYNNFKNQKWDERQVCIEDPRLSWVQ